MFNDKLTKSVADAVRQCISEEQKETQVQLNESKYTETKDKQGEMKSWKYEGDWEDSKEKKEGRGKVTHMSDVARRATEKMKKDDENVKEEVELTESELEEMSGAGWSAQKVHGHLKKSGWTLARTGGGHDVFTHPKAKNHIAVPRHKGDLKAPLVQGILKTVKMTTEAVELEEGLFPGTPEYEKKFGKVPQELKKGEKKKTSQGEMEKTGKGVVHRRSFREMVELYQTEGVKGLFEEISAMQEESSEEEFNAELKKQKAKAEGKAPQADVAAAATQGTKNMKEEVDTGEYDARKTQPTSKEEQDRVFTKHKERVKALDVKDDKKQGVVEEVEQVEERTLTEPETKEKERLVKGMKKGIEGFKERYGSRAKEVLYATATKKAKED